MGDDPQPPPQPLHRGKDPVHRRPGGGVGPGRDQAGVFVVQRGAAFGQLADQAVDRVEDVRRLEAGHHGGQAVVPRQKAEGVGPGDRRHMPGAEEAVHPEVRRGQQRPQRRFGALEQAEHREVGQTAGGGVQQGGGGAGGGGLEPHGQEHHLPVGAGGGQLHRLHGGVDGLHRSPQRPAAQQGVAGAGPGHPQQVAVAGKDHAGAGAEGQRRVDAAGRGDADRAAGAGEQLHLRRQQPPQPGAGNGHRVGAADLHEPQRAGAAGFLQQGAGGLPDGPDQPVGAGRGAEVPLKQVRGHGWPPGCRQGFPGLRRG